ncbi:MAG: aminotransferase class IV [Caldilineaceae bacterium]|nr:aminotransferase class IV [Caldilineaceae bacterium]
MSTAERVAYFNGAIVPESQVLVSFRDRSFKYGDGVFDMTRTFGGRIFKLREHLERFARSLKYVGIDPGVSMDELAAISEEVVARNLPLLPEGSDYWVGQRVSRGVDVVGGDFYQNSGPNLIVECTPLPLKARAHLYRDGIDVIFPSVQRIPPECLSPNVKSHNYLNLIMGDLEVRSYNPNAWSLLLDTRGFLAEGTGSNIFLVKDGALYTPKEQYVLAGVSRETVLELAEQLKLTVIEDDLTPYNAYTADEAFITSTSFCICPVHSFNNKVVADGRVPGPVTKRLTDAYVDLVDFDFVEQYLQQLH